MPVADAGDQARTDQPTSTVDVTCTLLNTSGYTTRIPTHDPPTGPQTVSQQDVLPQYAVSQHYFWRGGNEASVAAPDREEELGGADVAGVAAADCPVWLSELHGRPDILKLATASCQLY